jgi:hypothetical protein
MKRVTMGGTDPVVTDDGVADLILEYAKHLGRLAITDTVTVPSLLDGEAGETSMLLGPASQITVIPAPSAGGRLDPGLVETAREDLARRVDTMTGRSPTSPPAADEAFVDFDRYDLDDR